MTGEKMYTLEDDKETTSSLRQRDLPTTIHAPGDPASGSPHSAPTEANNAETSDAQQLSLSAQITQSFKKITTPAASRQAQPGSKGVALTALTIACIAVFFTAMDQTVVVTALPPIVTDLNIGLTKLDHAGWIISAYLLGFIITMPLIGCITDLYGSLASF